MLNENNKYIEIAKEKILEIIDKDNISVFVFGSMADNTYTKSSDLDIGFIGENKIDSLIFHKIRTSLEESIVPFHVDLVDFNKVDNNFKKIAMENIIIWNKAKNFN